VLPPPPMDVQRTDLRRFRKLPGVICNSFDGAVKLIHEHFRSPHTAPPVPFDGRLRLRPKPPGEGQQMLCSLLESRSEAAARVLPGDEPNSSAVDLLETPINLLPPCFFRPRVDGLIQAPNQRIDQSGANLGRKASASLNSSATSRSMNTF
jgi:hypothetical protein